MKRSLIFFVFIFATGFASCAHQNVSHVAGHTQKAEDIRVPHSRIYFNTASSKIPVKEKDIVEANASWLLLHPSAMFVLEGHCDERGGDAFNLELGDKRARAVKAALLGAGVGNDRSVIVISQGKRRPIDRRHNPLAWRRNRRVEFIVQ